MIKLRLRLHKEKVEEFLQKDRDNFEEFRNHLRNEAPQGIINILREKSPVDTGTLRDSFYSENTEKGFLIQMIDYGKYVEERTNFIKNNIGEIEAFLKDLAPRIAEEAWAE